MCTHAEQSRKDCPATVSYKIYPTECFSTQSAYRRNFLWKKAFRLSFGEATIAAGANPPSASVGAANVSLLLVRLRSRPRLASPPRSCAVRSLRFPVLPNVQPGSSCMSSPLSSGLHGSLSWSPKNPHLSTGESSKRTQPKAQAFHDMKIEMHMSCRPLSRLIFQSIKPVASRKGITFPCVPTVPRTAAGFHAVNRQHVFVWVVY